MCDLQHIFLFSLKLVFSIMNYFPQKSKSFFTWKECHFLKTHLFFANFAGISKFCSPAPHPSEGILASFTIILPISVRFLSSRPIFYPLFSIRLAADSISFSSGTPLSLGP